jgi:hypothetical protein
VPGQFFIWLDFSFEAAYNSFMVKKRFSSQHKTCPFGLQLPIMAKYGKWRSCESRSSSTKKNLSIQSAKLLGGKGIRGLFSPAEINEILELTNRLASL